MSCYDVVQCTALLNLELRAVRTSGSACVLHLNLVLVSECFGCVLGTPRNPEVSEVVWEFRSNPELECSPERGEHRGQV